MDELKPTVFLDRDGVLNADHGYVYQVKNLEVLPGVKEGLKLLVEAGFQLVIITNQSGIARGMYSLQDVEIFNTALKTELEKDSSVTIAGIYVCPHHPMGSVPEYAAHCECRKPKIGLVKQAQNDLPVNLAESFVIGDKESDIELARNLGIPGVQISGQYNESPKADFLCKTLEEAALYIISSTPFSISH